MKQVFLTLFFSLHLLTCLAQKSRNIKRPKLVVGIVIDQMRPDYLYRFYERFTENGFKRIMNEGHTCENTYINYLPSYTAPGHACVYTGSVPSLHGISSNDWLDKLSGQAVYCTADPKANAVGGTRKAGKMSPANLWANTITDELRLATNFRSKVVAVSIKDRGAILPGGHSANAAYWMDDSNGVFMSSDFYMKQLPAWVGQFNARGMAKQYMQQNWNTLYPVGTYTESSSDDNAYEGRMGSETSTSFPHQTSAMRNVDIKRTPYGNDIVLDFAKEALLNEQLGEDEETDFLAVSFSSTDYVGHTYGPNSIEIEDTYLRMDRTIAALIDFLNAETGEGNYSLFLTADHGVAHNPQYLLDRRIPGGFFYSGNLNSQLNKLLDQKFGKVGLVKQVAENFVWLNDSLLERTGMKRQEVVNEIIDQLKYHEAVQYVVDMQHLQQSNLPLPIREMATNGYVSKRSGDILILLNPGWFDAYSKTGTTHGTWNPYDTHIPLLWYGWGIQKGSTQRQVYMTDIAATLASLLHIQVPNACIGQTIGEVLK